MRRARLQLEITESLVMRDAERSRRILEGIKAMGIRLAIDDFGTGYSPLASIKSFPIDSLKIDRSFIKDIPRDQDDMAVTQAIIAMAHSLKLDVTAEGVETQEQLDFLHNQGCHEYQGHYFRKPLTADKFGQALHDNQAPERVWPQSASSRSLPGPYQTSSAPRPAEVQPRRVAAGTRCSTVCVIPSFT